MQEDILKRINRLPTLPDTIYEIQSITQNPKSTIKDLTKIVNKDPNLTANLLKAVNSPLYGFSTQIISIEQATSLFGMATIKGFAIASAIKTSFKLNLEPYLLSNKDFLNVSELQNILTIKWYSKIDRKKLDILATISFLLQLGQVIISSMLNNQYENKIKFKKDIENATSIKEIYDIEYKYFQISSEEITAKIFEFWHFDKKMIEIMNCFHKDLSTIEDEEIKEYIKILRVIKTAVNIKALLTEESKEEAINLANNYELNTKILLTVFEK